MIRLENENVKVANVRNYSFGIKINMFENRKCKRRNEKSVEINEYNTVIRNWLNEMLFIREYETNSLQIAETEGFSGKSMMLCVQLLTGMKNGIC